MTSSTVLALSFLFIIQLSMDLALSIHSPASLKPTQLLKITMSKTVIFLSLIDSNALLGI